MTVCERLRDKGCISALGLLQPRVEVQEGNGFWGRGQDIPGKSLTFLETTLSPSAPTKLLVLSIEKPTLLLRSSSLSSYPLTSL